jgi:fumarylacetoacetate (FAA) hydrolase
MKFATYDDGSIDGRLLVVAKDGSRAAEASTIAPNLLTALQRWRWCETPLRDLSNDLDLGKAAGAFAFEPARCLAPLPRTPQWCDGSAFLNHGRLMAQALKHAPIPDFDTVPVVYQGASDDFLGPHAEVPFLSEDGGIDFEGEFGVVVDQVEMGATPAEAAGSIRLIVQLNDWSLRGIAMREVRTGFGFLQSKPSTSFAPLAVTPDELGSAWRDERVHMDLHIALNAERVGSANGGEMAFSFAQLIAHCAATRRLKAGTIVGSGTVSNADRAAGSSCLAERRIIEIIEAGEARTPFLKFGDRVEMQARFSDGREGPFGRIDQRVIAARLGTNP